MALKKKLITEIDRSVLTGLINEATGSSRGLMPSNLMSKLQFFGVEPFIGAGIQYMTITLPSGVTKFSFLVNATRNSTQATILHIGNSSASGVLSAKSIGITTPGANDYKFYTKVENSVRTIIIGGIPAYSVVSLLSLLGTISSRTVSSTVPDLEGFTEFELLT